MLRGLYAGASGMLAGMERVDTISNNLANAATPGYKAAKATQSSFSEMVARAQTEQDTTVNSDSDLVGNMGVGTRVDSTWLVMGQGPLRFTDSNLNAAINGPGFFVIATPGGERYTRDGRFQVDGNGWLVTPEGYQVLGQQGPVQLTGPDAAIGTSGEVTSGEMLLDTLRIVDFANAGALLRDGGNLYSPGGAGAPLAITADLSPEHTEESNVNVVAEMAELIAATRYYEANQKVIQAEDDALAKAVTEVGKV